MNVKRRTRLNPLWTKRDVVDRIKTVDVRDYITTPFTTDITYSGYEFDLAAVVAAMEAGNGVCYIPPGDWRANAKNVALNDANLPAGRNGLQDKRKFTYRFTGAGKSSRVFFPLGMTTGDYLLIANSTNDTSSYHHHPKVICENFTVSGSGVMGTTNGSFIKLHQRSIKAKNMVLASLYNGFYSTGYADMTHAENISVEAQTAGGWAFTSVDVGDGHIYDQVHANVGENLINLRGAVGAQIRGCICGSYKIAYSDVSFVDCHLEGFKVEGDTTPKIQITASRVDIVSGAYFPTTAAPFIQIDDTDTNYYGTNLTIHEAARFITRLEGPASTYYALGGTALDIKTLSQGGSVRTKSAREGTYPSGGPSGGGAVADFQGIRVTASGYSALNTTLQSAAVRALLAGDTTIKFTGSYYEVLPTAGTVALRKGGTPTLAATAASQNFWSSNLTVGNTYYYAAHIIDAAGLKSALTAETSAAFTSGKGGVNLTYYMPTAPATLRIYRGTAAGTYTHWVDIPLALATGFFVDQGASIAGYTWNTGSVPTVPSASELVDGIHFTASGKKLFWAAAAPTVGTHAQGDYAINSAAATSSDAQGWICVSAGTPGTWVSSRADFASLTGTQTLSNKTLSYPKVNSIMDSNGNNALAVAATASAVNYLQARNQAAGSPPSLEAVGADTNISMYLTPKGTGGVGIYAATGQTPRISASGPDADMDLSLMPKGAGVVKVNGVQAVDLSTAQTLTNKTLTSPKINSVKDSNGNPIIGFNPQASAVNYVTFMNNATSGSPWITADGTDTNISMVLVPKGTGSIYVRTNTSGQPAVLNGSGPDANHDLNLVGKGTGVVRANGAEVITATRTINAQTGTTYTLVAGDAGKQVTLDNASAITLTIPQNSSVAFPVGTSIDLAQLGAGQVTVGGAGVTIRSTPGSKISAQYGGARLLKLATDTWLLTGNLSA